MPPVSTADDVHSILRRPLSVSPTALATMNGLSSYSAVTDGSPTANDVNAASHAAVDDPACSANGDGTSSRSCAVRGGSCSCPSKPARCSRRAMYTGMSRAAKYHMFDRGTVCEVTHSVRFHQVTSASARSSGVAHSTV